MASSPDGIPILVYHDIDPSFRLGSLSPTVRQFDAQMQHLKDEGFRAVHLDEVVGSPTGGAPTGRPVALTFDDAYEGVYRYALPVLMKYRFTATIFVVTRFAGRRSTWDLNLRWLGSRHMGWDAVRELDKNGIRVGSHTATHPNLVRVDPSRVEAELIESKERLEDVLGREVDQFSYPFGRYDERVKAEVQAAGYKLACGIRPRGGDRSDDPFSVKRICVRSVDRISDFRGKVRIGGPSRYQELKEVFLSACNRSSLVARRSYDRREVGE